MPLYSSAFWLYATADQREQLFFVLSPSIWHQLNFRRMWFFKKKTQEYVSSGFSLKIWIPLWYLACDAMSVPAYCSQFPVDIMFFFSSLCQVSFVRLELLNSSLCLPICSFTNFLSVDEVSNILLVSDNQFRGKYGINCLQHCLLISCNRAWHQLLHLLSLEPKTCR